MHVYQVLSSELSNTSTTTFRYCSVHVWILALYKIFMFNGEWFEMDSNLHSPEIIKMYFIKNTGWFCERLPHCWWYVLFNLMRLQAIFSLKNVKIHVFEYMNASFLEILLLKRTKWLASWTFIIWKRSVVL